MIDRKTPPRLNGIGDFTLPLPRRVFLDNGIPVVILDSRDAEISRVTVMTLGGTADAPTPAVANLSAAMQNEGIPSMDSNRLASLIDFNGASLAATAISHHTRTQLQSLPSRISELLPVMVATLAEPTLPEEELANVKRRQAASAELRESIVEFQASRLAAAASFGLNHPLADAITAKMVNDVSRDEILEFRRRFVRPDSMCLFVTGAVDDSLIRELNRTFGALPVPSEPATPIQILPFEPQFAARPKFTIEGAMQSAVSMTIPTITRDNPDYLNLRLAVSALGGYFGSRLQTEVRENQGLTYGIGARLLGYKEGGLVDITTQCDNASVDKVIASVTNEIHRLVSEPPTEAEMNRIAQAEFTQLLETTETPFTVTDFYITLHVAQAPIDYFERRVAAAHCITPQLISKMVEKYLDTDRMIISVAGANL